MRVKVILNKKASSVQKSKNELVSGPDRKKSIPAEDSSPLMLVLEDDTVKTLDSLKKEMEDLLVTISESRLRLEKLVDALLEEYAKVQAVEQRIKAVARIPSRVRPKNLWKKQTSASQELMKPKEFLGEGENQEGFKPEIECLQAIKHLIKNMSSLPDGLTVASGPGQPGAAAGQADGTIKVLIVEDDPVSRKLLSHFLEKENYRVLNAASAEEGFQSISRERPDLILLDIMLPGVDGFQFLSRLKDAESGPPPPVFVISSLTKESDIIKALQAGATDYILKPFSPQVILAKVRQFLRSNR